MRAEALLKRYRVRLAALVDRLDEDALRVLIEHAERMASRIDIPAAPARVAARPAAETVLQAIKRLNGSYPGLRRAALMQPVGDLLAQHMVDGRPEEEVIDALEVLYARAQAELARR